MKMMKKVSIFTLVLLAIFATACSSADTNYSVLEPLDTPRTVSASLVEYSESGVFSESDFIFQGTINSLEEREYQWKDESGDAWGPYYYTIYNIEVSKEIFASKTAYEKLSKMTDGTTVRMVAHGNSYAQSEPGISLDVGSEYIFLTHVLYESDSKEDSGIAQYDRFNFHNDADVYLQYNLYGAMPIVNDTAQMWDEVQIQGRKEVRSAKLLDSSESTLSDNKFVEAKTTNAVDGLLGLAAKYLGTNALSENASIYTLQKDKRSTPTDVYADPSDTLSDGVADEKQDEATVNE